MRSAWRCGIIPYLFTHLSQIAGMRRTTCPGQSRCSAPTRACRCGARPTRQSITRSINSPTCDCWSATWLVSDLRTFFAAPETGSVFAGEVCRSAWNLHWKFRDPLAHLHVECVMNALQCPILVPQFEIVVHRALRRQVLGSAFHCHPTRFPSPFALPACPHNSRTASSALSPRWRMTTVRSAPGQTRLANRMTVAGGTSLPRKSPVSAQP